jgi:hypothetical protein
MQVNRRIIKNAKTYRQIFFQILKMKVVHLQTHHQFTTYFTILSI